MRERAARALLLWIFCWKMVFKVGTKLYGSWEMAFKGCTELYGNGAGGF